MVNEGCSMDFLHEITIRDNKLYTVSDTKQPTCLIEQQQWREIKQVSRANENRLTVFLRCMRHCSRLGSAGCLIWPARSLVSDQNVVPIVSTHRQDAIGGAAIHNSGDVKFYEKAYFKGNSLWYMGNGYDAYTMPGAAVQNWGTMEVQYSFGCVAQAGVAGFSITT